MIKNDYKLTSDFSLEYVFYKRCQIVSGIVLSVIRNQLLNNITIYLREYKLLLFISLTFEQYKV
jgi:hypothetical protein